MSLLTSGGCLASAVCRHDCSRERGRQHCIIREREASSLEARQKTLPIAVGEDDGVAQRPRGRTIAREEDECKTIRRASL